MRPKEELLQELKTAVDSGVVTRHDVDALFGQSSPDQSVPSKKFSVAHSLFYVAGIILFAAVLSVIGQTWEGGTILHLLLTLVAGSLLWLVAYAVGKASSEDTDTRRGLADALLLTGSLLMITGGYIVTNLFGAYGTVDFFQAAPALLILAVVHGGVWFVIRRDLVYLMAILLGVATIGAVVLGLLRDMNATGDIWALAFIALFALLSWATHVVARLRPETAHLASAYDKLSITVGLLVMYIASFSEAAILWYMALAGAIVGVYYLSIVARQKILLGTASVFLVLMTITLSFRYFSAFGVTTSLILSAMAILGVAMLATNINKKYLS